MDEGIKYNTKRCLFCGEGEDAAELYPRTFEPEDLTPEIFSARRVTEHFHYKIVRCRHCGLVFSREILPDDVLARLYSSSRVTFDEYTGIIREDYWRHLSPFLNEINKGSALEIGCSSGFFLEKLLEEGFKNAYGCEPSIEAIGKAPPLIKKNIYSGFFKNGIYQKNSFDLVCSFQTLDHLSNPDEIIEICHNILRPNGIAYFIVHDVDSLQARILRDRSPIIDIEHIYLFNKKTLKKLFDRGKYKAIKVSDMKNSYPLSYWIKMLSLGGFGDTLKNVVERTRIGSISLPIAAGNIFIIAKPMKE